ncbi:MAG: EAL domain-containing protein [Pseudomonadota bacterium]
MTSLPIADRSPGHNETPDDASASIAGVRGDAIESELRRALDQGEIEVRFQPQFSCLSGAVIGAEALTRWRHPTLGMLGARSLFAMADRVALTTQLSQHVLGKALGEAACWPRELALSLNISPQELSDPRFAIDFAALVAAHGVDPSRLTLEITEDLLLRDIDQASRALYSLRDVGLSAALDDFGAGFCNFQYLRELPLDALKLDKSMIAGVPSDSKSLAVLKAILALGRALELEICAEGVEDADQLGTITSEGCDYWQGFLGGQAMPGEALLELT